jgi:hypothetical protein
MANWTGSSNRWECEIDGDTKALQGNGLKALDLWRELQVGNRIRLTEIPPEFLQEGYYVHRDTMRVYKRLLARRRALRIREIDQDGLPWIECRFRRNDGRWEWHWLALNHGGFIRLLAHPKTDRSVKQKAPLKKGPTRR